MKEEIELNRRRLNVTRLDVAKRIMAGFAANPEVELEDQTMAVCAVSWADALIAELNKPVAPSSLGD